MQQIWRRGLMVSVLAAALPLAACEDDIAGGENDGRVTVLLTDAAGDIETAIVTVNSIYLQSEGGEDDDEGGRVYLLGSADASADLEANLTDLSNSIDAIVDSEPVPAGTYQQLRIVIDDACIVVEGEDGADEVYASGDFEACGTADGNLQTTSATHSGLKINFADGPLVIEEGDEAEFLVDFDVAQSFHSAGNSGQWIMTPVLKGTSLDDAATVRVEVTLGTGVTLPEGVLLTGFSARLTNSEGSTEDLALDADGEADFRHLLPGTYTVTLVAPGGFTLTTDPASPTVTVGSGSSVTTNLTVTSIATVGI